VLIASALDCGLKATKLIASKIFVTIFIFSSMQLTPELSRAAKRRRLE
jgi:hypothetical protein